MLLYRANTVGVDVNPLLVDHCRRRGAEAHLSHSGRLPFGERTFNGALMDNVLEHLADPAPILGEIGRVLVPKGTLVVGVPGRKGYERDSDHKCFYSPESLVRCLAASGFTLKELFFAPFRWRYLDRALSQYCTYGVFDWTGA
jgi:SAM-dependent methyltransferase